MAYGLSDLEGRTLSADRIRSFVRDHPNDGDLLITALLLSELSESEVRELAFFAVEGWVREAIREEFIRNQPIRPEDYEMGVV